jgi:predicted negative regulator of RcsB-dependent stress response
LVSDENPSSTMGELRDLVRQVTRPFVDSVDSKLKDQVDKRVDEKVEQLLTDRLAVIERALADLDRAVKDVKKKLDKAK